MATPSMPEEPQETVGKELYDTSNRVKDDIKQIREWLLKQPHLKTKMDDQWLLKFLRSSKFSIERTKEKLDLFYTTRTLMPEVFASRDPFAPEIQDILNRGFILPLTDPLRLNDCLIFVRWNVLKYDKNLIVDINKVVSMVLDILLEENDQLSVCGLLIISDLKEYPFHSVIPKNLFLCKKSVLAVQDALPVKIQGLYFINAPSYAEKIYNLFRPILNEKIQSRVRFYETSKNKDIFTNISQTCFPKQYGGESGCLNELTEKWKKKVESYHHWFLEELQYRTDELKRPGKPKTSSDVFGLEGSFRKLEID